MSKRLHNNIENNNINENNKKIKLENKIIEEDINIISNDYINYIQELYDIYNKNSNISNIILQKSNIIKEFKEFIINNYKNIKQYNFDEINKYYYIYYYKFKIFLKIIKKELIDYYKYEYLIKEFKKLIYSLSYKEILNNWNYLKIIFIRLSLIYTFLYCKLKYYDEDDLFYLLNIFLITIKN